MKKLKHWLWQFARAHGPCRSNLTAWFPNFNSIDDRIVDKTATGTHEAEKAVSLKFSGAQQGNLTSAVTLVGDFVINWDSVITDFTTDNVILAGDNTSELLMRVRTNGTLRFYINGNAYDFSYVLQVSEIYTATVRRATDQLTLIVNGSSETISCATNDIIIRYVGVSPVLGGKMKGNLWDIYAEDSTGVKFSNFLAQGAGALVASETGPDVTLTGFTLPDDWTESVLYGHSWNQTGWLEADGGGTYDAGAKVPLSYVGTESGTAYIGTARQNLIDNGDSTYSPVSSLELFSVDVGTNFLFDVSGNPQTFTIADMAAWTDYRIDDKFFYNEYKAAFYSVAPSLVCLRQTENYIK